MHVKARGSFFGFLKHTLGYCQSIDGDYVSFGHPIPVGSKKVVRRLTLVNFSSEAINVDWTICNLVPGRIYADLDIDVQGDGKVLVTTTETDVANIQDPFKILTEHSLVESHVKTVVMIEFYPKEVGTFRGCVSARSGEFIHTLDLIASVCEQ